jgi:hypothetical protein
MLQSVGQLNGVSVPVQAPSPQKSTGLQSMGHVADDSGAMHCPSPQPPQSTTQVFAVSVGSQIPSPHTTRQSIGQVCGSPVLHTPSPQVTLRQSERQFDGVSPEPQMPSPQ